MISLHHYSLHSGIFIQPRVRRTNWKVSKRLKKSSLILSIQSNPIQSLTNESHTNDSNYIKLSIYLSSVFKLALTTEVGCLDKPAENERIMFCRQKLKQT